MHFISAASQEILAKQLQVTILYPIRFTPASPSSAPPPPPTPHPHLNVTVFFFIRILTRMKMDPNIKAFFLTSMLMGTVTHCSKLHVTHCSKLHVTHCSKQQSEFLTRPGQITVYNLSFTWLFVATSIHNSCTIFFLNDNRWRSRRGKKRRTNKQANNKQTNNNKWRE